MLLQDFLFSSLKDLKKTKIKQILKFGSVHVNGKEVTWYKHPLKAGDQVVSGERVDPAALTGG